MSLLLSKRVEYGSNQSLLVVGVVDSKIIGGENGGGDGGATAIAIPFLCLF